MGDIELFKDIKGFEGLYKVSNLGNVKALEKFINHPKGGLRKLGERILKLHVEKGKYTSVSLFDNGFLKTYKLHQLVAMAFHGHTPNGFKGLIVDHINGDKTDNRAINLQELKNHSVILMKLMVMVIILKVITQLYQMQILP